MQLRPSSLVRATGAGTPAAVRVLLLAGSDLAARRLDPVGLQPLAITPSADLDVLVASTPTP